MADKKRILIIDDDPDQVETVSMMLESKGFEPIAAYDGKEGLAKAKSEKPDLIILDVMMPNMDGYEVSKELKKDETLENIPVIMLTAVGEHVSGTKYSHASGMELEADDFFQKPVEPKQLVERVAELLKE